MPKNKTEQLIEEAVSQICELIALVRADGSYPSENFVPKIINTVANKSTEDSQNEIIKLKASIAHAIGFCRGIGHPETYLEKNYPELKN